MSRVLITGSEGQLAKCIQKISGALSESEFEFHNSETLDITDFKMVLAKFSEGNFDYCINCAAYTNVDKAEEHPKDAFAVNAEGVRNIALACQTNKVILIHISTDYVFDGKKEIGYTVHDLPNPINVYGKSKLKGEMYIQQLLEHYFVVRTSWLYSEFGKNFYKTILLKAKAGEDLQITDEQTGCPTNANDLARFVLSLIEKKSHEYGIHHFTNGEAMTWYDFAKKILKINGLSHMARLEKAYNYRTLAERPKYSVLN